MTLMAATADVAGDKVNETRRRLAAALERGKEIASRVREKAIESAKVADQAVHEHPIKPSRSPSESARSRSPPPSWCCFGPTHPWRCSLL